MSDIDQVVDWIREASHVVALTGAGMSTDSGISDYRGPQGLWTKNPEAERKSHIRHYVSDPELRKQRWKAWMDSPVHRAEPNDAHRALVDLERKGKLDLLVTQNIDGLHQLAGSTPEIVVEAHGTTRKVRCLECGEEAPAERVFVRIEAGEEDPPCRSCGGILKSATVSFGQQLVPGDLDRAFAGAERCDVLLCLGTLLSVYPIAHMADIARREGGRVVIINADGTQYDAHADAVFLDRLNPLLRKIVEQV